MVSLPLAQFMLRIPTGWTTDDPSVWLQVCRQHGSERLVLLNRDRRPAEVLRLSQLLTLVETSAAVTHPRATNGRGTAAGTIAGSPSAWTWETLALSTEALTAAHRVVLAPETCWVMVDEQQQYCGVLDTVRLLATILSPPLPTTDELATSAMSPPLHHQASASNTALLTYIGHELKTPLTSLLGLSSLLKLGNVTALSDRQNRYVSLIQQHCRRLADWVNTLIDLGRLESGTLRLMPHMVELEDTWQQAYQQAVLRVGQDHLPTVPPRLPLEHSGAASVTLVADPNRLQQMLSCLIQTALTTRADAATTDLPLSMQVWDNWLILTMENLGEALPLAQLSQPALTLPFAAAGPATPIAAEMGHWLDWLLVRKLAQAHRGELVFAVHSDGHICPTLLMPQTPAITPTQDSRWLLVLAPLDLNSLDLLWQQTHELNYRLLITQSRQDALEIAAHLPISAVLVLVQTDQPNAIAELRTLQTALAHHRTMTVALVPPGQSNLLGELPTDREILWPTDRLGSVLLQPPPTMPSPSRLTILYLRAANPSPQHSQKFPNIFHDFGCRVLEVDDLEQASLLRRVWKPDVAVLDPEISAPSEYLEHFSRFPELSSLPLITLTLNATQNAREVLGSLVFPCLVEEANWDTPEAVERLTTWLIQVLQVAATSSA